MIMSRNVQIIGKYQGVYENHPYYQLFFVEPIDKDGVLGYKPVYFKNGRGVYSSSLSCTKSVFDEIEVDGVYDMNSFLFDSRHRLAGL